MTRRACALHALCPVFEEIRPFGIFLVELFPLPFRQLVGIVPEHIEGVFLVEGKQPFPNTFIVLNPPYHITGVVLYEFVLIHNRSSVSVWCVLSCFLSIRMNISYARCWNVRLLDRFSGSQAYMGLSGNVIHAFVARPTTHKRKILVIHSHLVFCGSFSSCGWHPGI